MVMERRWSLKGVVRSRVFIGVAVAAASGVLAVSLGWAVVKSLDNFVIGPGRRRLREMTVPLREWVEDEYERTGSVPPGLLPEHAAVLDATMPRRTSGRTAP
jgi:hypothetical protein